MQNIKIKTYDIKWKYIVYNEMQILYTENVISGEYLLSVWVKGVWGFYTIDLSDVSAM